MEKGFMVSVLRRAGTDCSNEGVSASSEHLVVLDGNVPALFSPSDEMPAVELVEREGWDHPCLRPFLRPIEKRPGGFYSFGGNFAYSSDSRFEKLNPLGLPVPIHDRWERYP